MFTIFVIFIALIILVALFRGLFIEQDDFQGLYITAIIFVIIMTAIFIVAINQEYSDHTYKVKVEPKIEVKTVIQDNKMVTSDTTYIYKFKNE